MWSSQSQDPIDKVIWTPCHLVPLLLQLQSPRLSGKVPSISSSGTGSVSYGRHGLKTLEKAAKEGFEELQGLIANQQRWVTLTIQIKSDVDAQHACGAIDIQMASRSKAVASTSSVCYEEYRELEEEMTWRCAGCSHSLGINFRMGVESMQTIFVKDDEGQLWVTCSSRGCNLRYHVEHCGVTYQDIKTNGDFICPQHKEKEFSIKSGGSEDIKHHVASEKHKKNTAIREGEKTNNKITALRCADVGHVIAKLHVKEELSRQKFDLHSDGTSRGKNKTVGQQVTLADGSMLSLAYHSVAREDAKSLLEIAVITLEELSSLDTKGEKVDLTLKKLFRNLVGIMTDRAATMKLFQEEMEKKRKEILVTRSFQELLVAAACVERELVEAEESGEALHLAQASMVRDEGVAKQLM
ncbi:hypothetical protein BaRGS_00028492 [Batillaria attramentaria]|uniref:Zinc finger PHD-type domain-containing protein n=1 Tax=Batillaria attramentaria TaxID=370345 RepID=A0ABD0JYT4_9CAEN